MSILFLAGALFVNGLAAILFASFVTTKTGACNYKEKMYWKLAAVFLGSFVILCSIEAVGYSIFPQQIATLEKYPVVSESIIPAPSPLSNMPVTQNDLPQDRPVRPIKIIGYAERQQEMNAEVERQRKERDKHYALSDELKQKSYINHDDHSIADTPERGNVTYKPIKNDKNEYNQQSRIAEAGQIEQRESISEKKTRKTSLDEISSPDPTRRCSDIERKVYGKYRREIFKGRRMIFENAREHINITPKAYSRGCVEYDIQIEGKNPVHCRRSTLCRNKF